MRRVVVALAAVAAAALPAHARAARACRGLPVCIPIAGPWVVVPAAARGARLSQVEYQLPCRRGSVVGGTDALVSDRWLDLAFLGLLGSPLGPGVTARESAVFVGTYVGPARRPSSFRPFVGCVPTRGGGGRSTTLFAGLPPGTPLVRRSRNVVVPPTRSVTATIDCGRGERLVGSGAVLAFRRAEAPAVEELAAVHAVRREVDGRVVAVASRGFAVPPSARVEVQVQALCARRP